MTNLKMGDPDNQPLHPTGCTRKRGVPIDTTFAR